jgi:Acetyltransferase (GNAT) domain
MFTGDLELHWIEPSDFSRSFDLRSEPSLQNHFFLSRKWFESFFECWTVEERLAVIRVAEKSHSEGNGDTSENLGLIFLSQKRVRSPLGFQYVSIAFNEASSDMLAHVTPEMNGLVSGSRNFSSEAFGRIFDLLISLLASRMVSWDEIRFSAMPESLQEQVVERATSGNFFTRSLGAKKTYKVDLDSIRKAGTENYIDTRSKNTREQLRKALRRTEAAFGSLRCEIPRNQTEMLEWFDELIQLHKERWSTSIEGSGFSSPNFTKFHVDRAIDLYNEGVLHLWRVATSTTTLGYLHIYVVNRVAYFNMSGINYSVPSECKSGLLTHWKVIQFYLSDGLGSYDFMVGTNQYKQSLCTENQELQFFSVRKPRLGFALESTLRRLKVKGRLAMKYLKPT